MNKHKTADTSFQEKIRKRFPQNRRMLQTTSLKRNLVAVFFKKGIQNKAPISWRCPRKNQLIIFFFVKIHGKTLLLESPFNKAADLQEQSSSRPEASGFQLY